MRSKKCKLSASLLAFERNIQVEYMDRREWLWRRIFRFAKQLKYNQIDLFNVSEKEMSNWFEISFNFLNEFGLFRSFHALYDAYFAYVLLTNV